MTVSTATLTPSADIPVLGAGEDAEPLDTLRYNAEIQWRLDDTFGRGPIPAKSAIQRARTPDFRQWEDHIAAAAACSAPIRLASQIHLMDITTGEVLATRDTADMPDGVIYKACGNRRASICPGCAELYRQDCYQVIKSGLVGGKNTPTTVRNHPAVFATFTAPSFGAVHTTHKARNGKPKPCRGRRKTDRHRCPHGRPQYCFAHHPDSDRILGQPLCRDCYDYGTHVVWHAFAGELWRRTLQTATRLLRYETGDYRLKLSYGKVVEYQARAAVHFHAIIRADIITRANPDNPESKDQILPPPAYVTPALIEEILREAVTTTRYQTPAHPNQPNGWTIMWGTQFDVQPIIHGEPGTDDITAEKVAGYIAKYATKSTEITGSVSKPFTIWTIWHYANPAGSHTQRLIHAAWTLGTTFQHAQQTAERQQRKEQLAAQWQRRTQRQTDTEAAEEPKRKKQPEDRYLALTRWAHQYGYGGHYLTKSRKYATTFTALRAARQAFRRPTTALITPSGVTPPEQIQYIAALEYTATGWKTNGDQQLANTSATLAREWRDHARTETT